MFVNFGCDVLRQHMLQFYEHDVKSDVGNKHDQEIVQFNFKLTATISLLPIFYKRVRTLLRVSHECASFDTNVVSNV